MHLPKTAGSALRNGIKRTFGPTMRTLQHVDERQFRGIDPAGHDLFSGHFGYETATALDGKIVTVLRNPVDRFASVYYFWRSLSEKGNPTLQAKIASKYALDEFAQIRDLPLFLEEFYNRATWQLAFGSTMEHRRRWREDGRTEDELLQAALANVRSLALVGVQEDMDTFRRKFAGMFGVSLKMQRENVTPNRGGVFDLPARTIRAIQEWVQLDIEVYELARLAASKTA